MSASGAKPARANPAEHRADQPTRHAEVDLVTRIYRRILDLPSNRQADRTVQQRLDATGWHVAQAAARGATTVLAVLVDPDRSLNDPRPGECAGRLEVFVRLAS